MSFESSPSESQWTDAAPRDSISKKASSLIAATTTSYPCARAASRTRNGKRPLPAMRPSLGFRSTKTNKLELINVLLKRLVGEMANIATIYSFNGQAQSGRHSFQFSDQCKANQRGWADGR